MRVVAGFGLGDVSMRAHQVNALAPPRHWHCSRPDGRVGQQLFRQQELNIKPIGRIRQACVARQPQQTSPQDDSKPIDAQSIEGKATW